MPFLQSLQNSFIEMKTEFSILSYKTDLYHIVIVCDAQCKHNQDLYLYCIFIWYMVVSIAICIMFFWIFSGACQFPLNCYTNHIRLEVYWLFFNFSKERINVSHYQEQLYIYHNLYFVILWVPMRSYWNSLYTLVWEIINVLAMCSIDIFIFDLL